MNYLCGLVAAAYGVVIIRAVIRSHKDKKELKELDKRLEGYLKIDGKEECKWHI